MASTELYLENEIRKKVKKIQWNEIEVSNKKHEQKKFESENGE